MIQRHQLKGVSLAVALAAAACGSPGGSPGTNPPTSAVSTPVVASAPASPASSGPVLDQAWATVELTDVRTGDTFRLADHAGKVIIIETMAIWCPNCLIQEAEVHRALERLDQARVVYVALDVDLHEDAAALEAHRAEYDLRGMFVVAGIPIARALAEEFGANVLNPPLTPIIIVSTEGVATLTDYGRKRADDIVALAVAAGA